MILFRKIQIRKNRKKSYNDVFFQAEKVDTKESEKVATKESGKVATKEQEKVDIKKPEELTDLHTHAMKSRNETN